MLATQEDPDPWPQKLKLKQGLKLQRGEVLVYDLALHAVVGFDGRNEGYICWRCDARGVFDTTRQVLVERTKAHSAARDPHARAQVPPLPDLEHTGRLAGTGSRARRPSSVPSPEPEVFDVSAASSSKASPMRLAPWECASTAGSTPRWTPPFTPPLQDEPVHASKYSSAGDGDGGLQFVPQHPAQPRSCVVCVVLRGLVAGLSSGLCVLREVLRGATGAAAAPTKAPLLHPGQEDDADMVEDIDTREIPRYAGSRASQVSSLPRQRPKRDVPPQPDRRIVEGHGKPRADAFEDMQITIPIVKPVGWEEVQPLLTGKAVTFDERGLKETMTVKSDRWGAFVDRQKAKLEKEIRELRHAKSQQQGSLAAGTAGALGPPAEAPAGRAEDRWIQQSTESRDVTDEDIGELEQLVERMDDWKDLSRYSGKSISMASTRLGNEMKIHVMAFAEREDGAGVDFMRLAYKKSVEVRERRPPAVEASQRRFGLGSTLWSIMPFFRSPAGMPESVKEEWIQLLQRPDVAKFTIALAFRNALQNDGIHLQFCDARLEDLDTV